ncbi:uncharacterized protein BX663DRAFT_549806 [Cokeromyces recurvatus]|uniref:uncharacterized protein n=1 Tax=Cokeromyces recurvatus TaxID=90255 RepID=UPI00221FBE52|nr:uncharacterized protein BX663DRAFT_549806 [Cokeromyces recurvatus]KAI7904939.1 hypothetical protein BX663DRAFT_549806 [Cokeromyces recurvatus]
MCFFTLKLDSNIRNHLDHNGLKFDLSNQPTGLASNIEVIRQAIKRIALEKIDLELHLRNNQLSSFEEYAHELLVARHYIKYISLRENAFDKFPTELTIFCNLTALSLSRNFLLEIPKGVFPRLNALQWINLGFNYLEDLPSDFIECKYLRGIELSNNKLLEIPKVLFSITTIEELGLQSNKIKFIPKGYIFPKRLRTLNLSFNEFEEIPMALIYQVPELLSVLLLSGNPLEELPDNFLHSGYQQLCCLDLHSSVNRLREIPKEIGYLRSLQWLNLNGNRLHELPNTMASLSCLIKLGLAQNRLESLPSFLFMHMMYLEKIDIRANRLQYLPSSTLSLIRARENDSIPQALVPRTVFKTCNRPQCILNDCYTCELRRNEACAHLKSIIIEDNPKLKRVDGIFYIFDEKNTYVQLISLSDAYHVFDMMSVGSNGIIWKADREKMTAKLLSEIYSTTAPDKVASSYSPIPSSIMDDHDYFSVSDDSLTEISDNEEVSIIHVNIQRNSTEGSSVFHKRHPCPDRSPLSLREICLRVYFTRMSQQFEQNFFYSDFHAKVSPENVLLTRLDQDEDVTKKFLSCALNPYEMPPFIVDSILLKKTTRQCDHCHIWFTKSNYQVGCIDKLGSLEEEVPIRFDICSLSCAVDAVVKLYIAQKTLL